MEAIKWSVAAVILLFVNFAHSVPAPIPPIRFLVTCRCGILDRAETQRYLLTVSEFRKVGGVVYAQRERGIPERFLAPWDTVQGKKRGYSTESEAEEAALTLDDKYWTYHNVYRQYNGEPPSEVPLPDKCFGFDNFYVGAEEVRKAGYNHGYSIQSKHILEETDEKAYRKDATVFLSGYQPHPVRAEPQYIRVKFPTPPPSPVPATEGVIGPCRILKYGRRGDNFGGIRNPRREGPYPQEDVAGSYPNALPPTQYPPTPTEARRSQHPDLHKWRPKRKPQ